ncbi:hypothetical protein [Rhodoferax sp. UBA5149]|uniref:hypothetical protein n=1 Tax=Rhodoferax sp. UBA5149 TaxID=1947379 RepID=UPI0025E4324F|nr:hypothetical protein [Rhodoferax sp. UBA5149]
MKTLLSMAAGMTSLLSSGASFAQNGNMMNGGTWGVGSMGEYGGIWVPILLVIVVVGFVAWIVKRGGK